MKTGLLNEKITTDMKTGLSTKKSATDEKTNLLIRTPVFSGKIKPVPCQKGFTPGVMKRTLQIQGLQGSPGFGIQNGSIVP